MNTSGAGLSHTENHRRYQRQQITSYSHLFVLQKAFYYVHHNRMIYILNGSYVMISPRSCGHDPHQLQRHKVIVTTPEGITDAFRMTSGALQGHTMAPYLFIFTERHWMGIFSLTISKRQSGEWDQLLWQAWTSLTTWRSSQMRLNMLNMSISHLKCNVQRLDSASIIRKRSIWVTKATGHGDQDQVWFQSRIN